MTAENYDVNSSGSDSKSGVALVWIGAALVLAAFVLFEIIAGEYFVTTTAVVLAAAILVLPRLAPDAIAAIATLPAFTKALGYFLALAGVVELLDDVRFDVLDEFVAIVGALVAYAGYGLAAYGARSIKL